MAQVLLRPPFQGEMWFDGKMRELGRLLRAKP